MPSLPSHCTKRRQTRQQNCHERSSTESMHTTQDNAKLSLTFPPMLTSTRVGFLPMQLHLPASGAWFDNRSSYRWVYSLLVSSLLRLLCRTYFECLNLLLHTGKLVYLRHIISLDYQSGNHCRNRRGSDLVFCAPSPHRTGLDSGNDGSKFRLSFACGHMRYVYDS